MAKDKLPEFGDVDVYPPKDWIDWCTTCNRSDKKCECTPEERNIITKKVVPIHLENTERCDCPKCCAEREKNKKGKRKSDRKKAKSPSLEVHR